jgi:hypothetical protein
MHVSPRKWTLPLLGIAIVGICVTTAAAADGSNRTATTQARRGDPAPAPPTHGKVQLQRTAKRPAVHRASWPAVSWSPFPKSSYVPRHQRTPANFTGTTLVGSGAPTEEIIVSEPDIQLSMSAPGYGDPGYGDPGCADPGCDGDMCGDCNDCGSLCIPMCCLPVPCISFRHLSFEVGVHGFKGPMNGAVALIGPNARLPIATDSSFGFHYGLNWGTPAPLLAKYGVGLQLGAGVTHSNMSGSLTPNLDRRNQAFATIGAFRRVEWGLQGGFVLDYHREDWYLRTDMWQIRAELSWIHPCNHEFGVLVAGNVQDDVDELTGSPWRTTDYYTFFYRKRFDPCGGAEARIMAGATGESDGLLGLDVHLPLNDCWALETGFNYLIPTEGRTVEGVINESWNVGFTFVWYPNGRARVAKRTCFEPLFDVANNGSLFVDQNLP